MNINLEMGLNKMSTTYYLLRTKTTPMGNGSYLGINRDGVGAIVNTNQDALRFDALDAAEQHAVQIREELGEFEIELRNTNENTME